MARSDYNGKRGANAGDDYHELWAARRALELIVPGSNIVGLTVEGVSPEDAAGIDDAQWDGVDAACYRGPDFETIEAIDLVQLKYSGSEPNKAWTIARLAHASNKSKSNSLMNRLASAWKSAREKHPDLDRTKKISIKLVSNQPVAKEIVDALTSAGNDPDRSTLRAASGLSQEAFDLFVTALDLSECGDHPRRFSAKLAAAAEALAARNPEALLVIAVDAADNAVTAARQCAPPETAFIHDFARLGDLPSNVRLLLSARQGRLAEINLPEDVELIQLGPFMASESRMFAEALLGPQSDGWNAQFHTHSGGNPRVQRYAIEFANGIAAHALDYLKPNGKDLAGIFGARLNEARLKSGAPADLAQICAGLVLLPRPVPIHHLSGTVAIDREHARDLILDLTPGLVIDQDCVGFADEDFEHFVREAGQTAMDQITQAATDWLMAMRDRDAYAAAHVSSLALILGRRDTVIGLVREPVRDYPIADAGARGVIHRRRLRAAMHVCRESGNTIDAAALLLEGAHAIKTDEAVHRMLLDHIELASHFSREAIIALLLRDRERRPGHGALLLHLAGLDGIEGDRVGVNSHFRSFMAWQDARREVLEEDEKRRRAADPDDEYEYDDDHPDAPPIMRTKQRRHYPAPKGLDRGSGDESRRWTLEADDVAAMFVGRLHVEEVADVAKDLSRPHPARFRYRIFTHLVRRLARRGDFDILAKLSRALPRHHPGHAIIALAFGIAGKAIDCDAMLARIERASAGSRLAARRFVSDFMEDDAQSEEARFLLDACDLVATHGGDRSRLRRVLDRMMPSTARTLETLIAHAPRASDVAARAFALACILDGKAVTFEDFVVEAERDDDTKRPIQGEGKTGHAGARSRKGSASANERAAQRDKAKEIFGTILDLHAIRAQILLGDIKPANAPVQLAAAVAKLGGSRRFQHRQDEWRPRDDEAVRALLTLGAVPGVDCPAIFAAIAKALGPVGSLLRFGVRALLEHASYVPGFRGPIISLAIASCEDARVLKMPAEEKIDYLIGLARLLLPLDREAANHCFDAANGIAGDVDYDTLHAIAITSSLAERAVPVGNVSESDRIARGLTAVIQDAAQRLGESDRFPWDDVAIVLATLSPSVALAAASRFAELDLLRNPDVLASMLGKILSDGSLDTSVLAAFLPVLGSHAEEFARQLAMRAIPNGVAVFEEIARQLLFEPTDNWVDIAKSGGALHAPGELARSLAAAAAFVEARPEQPTEVPRGWSPADRKELSLPVDPALFEPAGIDGVASFLSRVDAIMAAEAASYPSRYHAAERVLARVPVHRIAAFFDIITAIPEDDFIVYDLTRLLMDQFDRWKDQPVAARWAREHLLDVIESRLPELLWNIDYRAADLVKLLALTEVPDAEIATRLLTAIEANIDALSSHGVFRLVGLLSRYLTPDEASGALGLHRYRCRKRNCEIGLCGKMIAWFAISALPGLTMVRLLILARATGNWRGGDAFTLFAVVILSLVAANWWLIPRLRFGIRLGLLVFLVGVPLLVLMLGTSAGTLLLFAPGSEFAALGLLGPMVVVLISLSFLALGFGLTVAISRRRRLPVFAGIVFWVVALAWFDLNDNHPVRLQPNAELASAARNVRDDDSLWINDSEWPAIFARWQHSTLHNGDKRPIVLVSAEGGGIRAAYFTAATLGRIADNCPPIAREVLAVSGISGGSLGVAAYAMAVRAHPLSETDNRCNFSVKGRGYYEAGLSRMFRRDLLSPVLSRAMFPDFAQRLIPFPIESFDRQLGIELALRAAFKQEFGLDSFAAAMGQPDGSYRFPFLVVGATSVNSGNQKLFSEFDQVPYKGSRLQAFNLASVVASSARFPLISPPGHFYGDLGEVRNKLPVPHKIELVDGGYYDNSGAYALTEILDRINYYRHHDDNGDRTDTPPLDPDTPVVWIRISNSPDCIEGYPSRYLDALCASQKRAEQHPTFGLEELLSPLKAISGARTAKERITILATRQLLDERNELEKSRDFEIDIQMAPIEDDIPLGWYLSARSADSLSWQLSAKAKSQCRLNSDDSALASCALERIQYLFNPQSADLARVDTDLADFLFGHEGMQYASCEYANRGKKNVAAAIAACDKADHLPTAYCVETPLHPTACRSITSNHTAAKWFAPGN